MNAGALAWRNIRRNRRRTVITVCAVGLNTAVLISTFALIGGIRRQITFNATAVVVGDAQVHGEGYLEQRSLYDTIPDSADILRKASSLGVDAAPRSYGYGLVAHGKKSAGGNFWGVLPDREREAFALPSRVRDGNFLTNEATGGVVLGNKLARSLHAQVGSELVTVVQAADGSLGNELFTVVGILGPAGEDIDRGAAILHRDDFEKLFLLGGRLHEIALTAKGAMSPEHLRDAMLPVGPKTEVKTWREILPTISDILAMQGSFAYIFAMVFFIAAGFGVMNTMLMATHDRIREYGVLKALGTSSWRLLRDVSTEGLLLALLSTLFGGALGVGLSLALQHWGIDLSGVGGEDISFGGIVTDPIWRAELSMSHVVESCIMMWVICVLASLYPALRVLRLNPVEAMHHR